MEYDVASIINANHFYRDYLIGQKATTERKIEWGGEEKAIELDNTDLEILDAIAKNSRVSAVDIANKLNISSDTVLNRIKQLEKSRIIEHYMIWPDVNKLCGLYYKVLVRLKEFNKEKEKMLYSYCLNNPNIVYIVNCFGQWQFEMDIEVENIKEFRELMRDFINNFSDIVSDYTALNIYEEYKFIFFEKGVIKPT